MKFSAWKIDDLIQFLQMLKSAPPDRLDYDCVTRCFGEIYVENGEQKI